MQKGDTPVQVLFEVHILWNFPTILYPLLQIKVAMDPILKLFVKTTPPFRGDIKNLPNATIKI